MRPEEALELFDDPPRMGVLATACRDAAHGPQIWIRPSQAHDAPAVAGRLRNGAFEMLSAWPQREAIADDDRLLVQIDPSADARARYVRWLDAIARPSTGSWSVAPYSRASAGVHRLWCIASTRLLLPDTVRIEARHDLIGIRLAQIALGFGADTFGGPIEPDRKLPLAGVTRPNEATLAGLQTLVRQAGLQPHTRAL